MNLKDASMIKQIDFICTEWDNWNDDENAIEKSIIMWQQAS